jgi:four helix bundle protein
MTHHNAQNIRDRSFAFGCDTARFALSLAPLVGVRVIIDQLLKAGTAVGANLEEAKAGSSRREFIRFVEIALREARETLYWLRIGEALKLGSQNRVRELRGEADQFVRILTAIVVNTKRRTTIGLLVTVTCILSWVSFVS